MKKIILYTAFMTAACICGRAQDTASVSAQAPAASSVIDFKKLKTDDQALPRWAFDVTYKYGTFSQDIQMVNLVTAYTTTKDAPTFNSNFSKPVSSGGNSHIGSIHLGYFMGKSRKLGLGIGVSWFQQSSLLTMDHYTVQYQSKDNNSDIFRQILTNNGAVTERVTMTNIVVPVLLKFKHQFKRQGNQEAKLGVAIDAGALIGIRNSNKYNSNARFNYEAIYKYDNANNAIYDTDPNFSASSEPITEEYWNSHKTSDQNVNAYFDFKRSQGMNVALNRDINKDNTTKYKKNPSFGFIIQPSLTYQLSYNMAFMIGGYYSYMVFSNDDNQRYRLTDKVGDYNSITEGVKKNTATSYGLNVGFRFYFGEKRDIDWDGIPDKEDECRYEYGSKEFKGCADTDRDGIKDDEDDCDDLPGEPSANGCPDADFDGVADSKDACPDVAGPHSSDPEYNGCPIEKIIARKYGNVPEATTPVPKYDTLQTNMINFEFGKSEVLPSNYAVLDDAAEKLANNSEVMILISGYTDSVGSDKRNMELSLARAEAVSVYLQNAGVGAQRIITVGYGKQRPITSNDHPEERAKNRRTEMMLMVPVQHKK